MFLAGTAVGLAGWIAGQFASRLWESLAASTLWLAHDLLKQCAEDVVFVPAQRVIGTATFQVKIGRPCSGFEGMGLMLVLIASFLVISRQVLRFPRALWLLPLGCLLSYLGNVVRIVVLIWLGSHVSKDLALGAFHSRAGPTLLPGRRIHSDSLGVAIVAVFGRRSTAGDNRLDGL